MTVYNATKIPTTTTTTEKVYIATQLKLLHPPPLVGAPSHPRAIPLGPKLMARVRGAMGQTGVVASCWHL